MGCLGFVIGAFIGSLLLGAPGLLIGAFLGPMVERYLRRQSRSGWGWGGEEARAREEDGGGQRAFLTLLSAMMAKLSKLDGRITEDEIRGVNRVFDQLHLSEDARACCIESFRAAKDSDESIYDCADRFARSQGNVNIRIILYDILWQLAAVDGGIHPAELEALRELPMFLQIPSVCFRAQYARYFARSSQQGSWGGSGSWGGAHPEERPQAALSDDYEFLGVSSDATDDEVKRAYREKAKKLHPDELASQGLPPELEKQANEQMARLNAAYDRIKKARGRNRRAGFTLLELLAVLGILSVLLGIVFSAMNSVHARSRRALARAEVRTVESALKAYLDYYGNWTRLIENLPDEDRFQKGPVECFAIGEALGYALEGDSYVMGVNDDTGSRAHAMNPDAIPFIEFSRHYRDANGANTLRFPVNPWGDNAATPDAQTLGTLNDARYFVAIDANCNGSITLPSGARFPEMGNGRLSRAVVVWTYHPKKPKEEAIVSWLE